MTTLVAAAAYPLDFLADWQAYEAKLTRWVAEAAGQGAALLVFPEYGAMELASLGGAEVAADLDRALAEVAGHAEAHWALNERLARAHGVTILAASVPVVTAPGAVPVNRAALFGPGGRIGHQDKVMMTRFEREQWHIAAGQGLSVFDTAVGRVGICICYDSEFPLIARALCEAGAEILLVPSCTDSHAGFTRVRVGAMARALENQCVAIQSPTVGLAAWCPAVDENWGRAAVYGPADRGWPDTGILAETGMNVPGWCLAEISLDLVRDSRADGGVMPFAHWPEQAMAVAHVTIAGRGTQ
ncbi:carbon-nitrogen hydrolase family protein [Frigidibacter sp. MR17.24]|uniref:carbon-nitrogen hydrolase family protein n=1 Tax=Frigidibacter sp. MR17.24 TaxID=3127345 RepID=UPI003012C2C2